MWYSIDMTRKSAISHAEAYFGSGAFREDLARRIQMPTESQNPERRPALVKYFDDEIKPAFEDLGFIVTRHEALPAGHS